MCRVVGLQEIERGKEWFALRGLFLMQVCPFGTIDSRCLRQQGFFPMQCSEGEKSAILLVLNIFSIGSCRCRELNDREISEIWSNYSPARLSTD